MNPFSVRNILIGMAAGAVATMVLPAVARTSKPAIKAALKAGMSAYQKALETAAELGEATEDMVAEVKSELAEELAAEEAAAAAAANTRQRRGPTVRVIHETGEPRPSAISRNPQARARIFKDCQIFPRAPSCTRFVAGCASGFLTGGATLPTSAKWRQNWPNAPVSNRWTPMP